MGAAIRTWNISWNFCTFFHRKQLSFGYDRSWMLFFFLHEKPTKNTTQFHFLDVLKWIVFVLAFCSIPIAFHEIIIFIEWVGIGEYEYITNDSLTENIKIRFCRSVSLNSQKCPSGLDCAFFFSQFWNVRIRASFICGDSYLVVCAKYTRTYTNKHAENSSDERQHSKLRQQIPFHMDSGYLDAY